jgi:hypothetical protein
VYFVLLGKTDMFVLV